MLTAREKKIVYAVGNNVKHLAELGCGDGNLAPQLLCKYYTGYDKSIEAISKAKEIGSMKDSFVLVDVFNFQSDIKYDCVLVRDLVSKSIDPVGSVMKLTQLWESSKYIFTMLLGSEAMLCDDSFVIPFAELFRLHELDNISFSIPYIEVIDSNKAWIILEVAQQ